MRTISQDNLLPLWETVSTTATVTVAATAPLSKSESKDSSAKMILVSVSEELENVLREVARDVDGVDASLRRKLTDQLDAKHTVMEDDKSAEEEEEGAEQEANEKGTIGRTGGSHSGGGGGNKNKRKRRCAVSPSTLAQAVPHVRRLRPPGEGGLLQLLIGRPGGSGGSDNSSDRGRGSGSKIIFTDARGLPMMDSEEKRAYDARREQMLLRRQQREYARMTANIQIAPRETVRDIQASFKFQAGMGANMVLAVLSAFIVSYWASKYVVGNNTAHRMVVGLVGAVFILLVELLVFVTRSLKADEVLEAARQDAEESHTDLGVPRAASALAPPRRRGIGVLDGNGGGSRGKYEMVPQGLSADDGDSVDNHPPGDKESDGRGGGGVEKDSGVKGSSR